MENKKIKELAELNNREYGEELEVISDELGLKEKKIEKMSQEELVDMYRERTVGIMNDVIKKLVEDYDEEEVKKIFGIDG